MNRVKCVKATHLMTPHVSPFVFFSCCHLAGDSDFSYQVKNCCMKSIIPSVVTIFNM